MPNYKSVQILAKKDEKMTKRIFKLLGLTFLTFVMITSKVSANVYSQEEIEKNMEQVEGI